MSDTELYNKGTQLYNAGRYVEAIEWLDKALRINPDRAITLSNKGLALHKLGRLREAIECYDKALRINPNHANTVCSKGVVLKNLGRHQESIEWFDKALRINPDDAIYICNKGDALGNLGRHQEAIEWFDKALRIKPDYTLALLNKKSAQDAMMRRVPNASVARNFNVVDEFSALNINSKNNNKRFDVFISYSWKQKPQARNLFNVLTQSGLFCWMDDNQLQAGSDLDKELADAIYNSKLVIFCISSHYLKSDNCLREFNYTFTLKKQFIPVLFCKNKKEEFGEWPCHHQVFFKLAQAIYVSNIFEHLDNTTSSKNTAIVDFIKQVKNKL